MTKIGIIRCEKNEKKCPLTGGINSLAQQTQGFASYDQAQLTGVFTCRGDMDDVANMAKILKAKGAETIHVPTCLFANKSDGTWIMEGGGFCDQLETLTDRIMEAGIPCVQGTAHLPKGYVPKV